MRNRFLEKQLEGWGRYPRASAHVYRPERVSEAADLIAGLKESCVLARGLGRSYGDAALNSSQAVLLTERLNCFLELDSLNGTAVVEAGVSIADILHVCLPRGWFPAVTPGTQFVTVGGAIGCDIHGKNHHHCGAFGQNLEWFDLLLADGSQVRCSAVENRDLFYATLGGMGLTGIILRAKVRLVPVETAHVKVHLQRSGNLDEVMERLRDEDRTNVYTVAWIDALAGGSSLGRGIVMSGNHATRAEVESAGANSVLKADRVQLATLPFDWPSGLLNRFTLKLMNLAYYQIHSRQRAALQSYAPFFYPLDRIGSWNRAYGRPGFLQYQIALPDRTSHRGIRRILETFSRNQTGSFLAVLKRLGPGTELLSFPIEGYTLALDLPFRGDSTLSLLDEIDEWVIENEGRIYLAKDARVMPDRLARMYPGLERWKQIRKEADPTGLFSSDMARRLGLVEAG